MYNYAVWTEQIRACVSCYVQLAWTANDAKNDAHIASTGVYNCINTQGCQIKKRNGKLVMHQKIS